MAEIDQTPPHFHPNQPDQEAEDRRVGLALRFEARVPPAEAVRSPLGDAHPDAEAALVRARGAHAAGRRPDPQVARLEPLGPRAEREPGNHRLDGPVIAEPAALAA